MGSTRPLHPGSITFVDLDDGSETTAPLSRRLESLAYAEFHDRIVPVTRIVRQHTGRELIIRAFGPDGEFLHATIGIGA